MKQGASGKPRSLGRQAAAGLPVASLPVGAVSGARSGGSGVRPSSGSARSCPPAGSQQNKTMTRALAASPVPPPGSGSSSGGSWSQAQVNRIRQAIATASKDPRWPTHQPPPEVGGSYLSPLTIYVGHVRLYRSGATVVGGWTELPAKPGSLRARQFRQAKLLCLYLNWQTPLAQLAAVPLRRLNRQEERRMALVQMEAQP